MKTQLSYTLLVILSNLLCFCYSNRDGDFSQNYGHHYNQYYNGNHNPSEFKTEYEFETIQSGSTYIDPHKKDGGSVRVSPDNVQHYFVKTQTATNYLNKGYQSQKINHLSPKQLNNEITTTLRPHKYHRRYHHRHRSTSECVRCPVEKVLIAQKGLDGVLIDPPKLLSCRNRAIPNNVYSIETLFGSQFKFLLPHGTHSFYGKIRSKTNKNFEQTCILRYKVIVQQCRRFYPQDPYLHAKCDPGYIWGSKCHFTCRSGYLSHNNPIVCGDSLNWEGDEPECLPEEPKNHLNGACEFIEIPENGKFSCEYPHNVNHMDYENELVTPEGTVCHVTCNRNYEIPRHLMSFNSIRCENGAWNSTTRDLCQPRFN